MTPPRGGPLLDAELVVVGVRRGLAHREHDDEQADPYGRDYQYYDTQVHLSLAHSGVPMAPAPLGHPATRLPAMANDRTGSQDSWRFGQPQCALTAQRPWNCTGAEQARAYVGADDGPDLGDDERLATEG